MRMPLCLPETMPDAGMPLKRTKVDATSASRHSTNAWSVRWRDAGASTDPDGAQTRADVMGGPPFRSSAAACDSGRAWARACSSPSKKPVSASDVVFGMRLPT